MHIFEKPNTLQECLERLKQACEILYDECEYPDNYSYFNPPAAEEQIQRMEQRLGFALPDSYRQFLKFANGARIMDNSMTIYDLRGIGMSDRMVPDGYLTIGEAVGDGERIAISEADGKIYSCYNGEIASWNMEHEMAELLKNCELEIEDIKREKEKQKRDSETIERDKEEFEAFLERIKRSLEANKK